LSPPGSQAFGQRGRAAIVEAHAIDESFVWNMSEHPGLGIARLSVSGHPAQLAKAKSHRFPHRDSHRLFVHASAEPHRVGKAQAHGLHRERGCLEERLGQLARPAPVTGLGQQPEGPVVDRLGVLSKKERASDVAIQPTHATSTLPGMPPFGQMGFVG
jgi:hypothetical protein